MKNQFFVVVDNVRSIENVGSVFRTSDAFGVDAIYICGISPTPKNEKLAKTSLGSEKTVAWEYHAQTWRLLRKLKSQGVFVVALEQASDSVSLEKCKPKFPLAVVIGHEVKGVSPSALKLSDSIIEIPMLGKKESLNVAVAFGVAGYAIQRMAQKSA